MSSPLFARIAAGRTDLVHEHLASGGAAAATDADGVSLAQWCAYHGDVSALRLLIVHGVELSALGRNFDLNGAAFHGHWKLCRFLIDNGADVATALPDTGETPLHAALSGHRPAQRQVVRVLLARGADPNRQTKPGIPTGAFMRDCRTRAETPLHRAAAFADGETIRALLDAGGDRSLRDNNGDSPLSWASWHCRPVEILRLLCFGEFAIHREYTSMQARLIGEPDD
jgi:ankyrin repeat protein